MCQLQPETRLHEGGIASNRKSARYGELYIWGVLTTRQAEKKVCTGRVLCLNLIDLHLFYIFIQLIRPFIFYIIFINNT